MALKFKQNIMDPKNVLKIFSDYFISISLNTKVPIFVKPIISVHRGHVALYSLPTLGGKHPVHECLWHIIES